MRRNICFIGKAGAGKSSAADFLTGAGYTRLSFAQPLKDIAAQIWGPEARTNRDLLIPLGMKIREIDPDAWYNLLIRRIQVPPERADEPWDLGPVVIDDCRFANEYWALRGAGFVFVRIYAEEDERLRRLQASNKEITVEQMLSPSECELDTVAADHILYNTGDYDDLIKDVAELVGRINA